MESNIVQRTRNRYAHKNTIGRTAEPRRTETRTSIARELGRCVYAARCPDGTIKIGCTDNLDRRIRKLGARWDDVLAVKSGDYQDEADLHRSLTEHLAHGREYYRPTAAVVAWINEVRVQYGLPRYTP